MAAIYIVWAVFLWRASREPAQHLLFVDFTIWATAAHALVMLIATPLQKSRSDRGEPRGVNGGANRFVAHRRRQLRLARRTAEMQRPALSGAGRIGLRIESSTTELRWR